MLLKMKLKNKIIGLVVLICLFALLSISIVSYITLQNMADYSAETNTALGNQASGGARDALMEQAHQFLQTIVQQQARNCDSMLNTLKYEMELVHGVVTDMFINPDYYSHSRPVIHASEVTAGIYSNTYSLMDSIPMTDEILRERDLLSNLSLLTPTLIRNENIVGIYVGMESGLFFNYTSTLYDTSDYDPRVRPWYIKAAAFPGEVILTDIYEDAFGLGLIVTVAKAFHGNDGDLLGVAAFDVLLQNLEKLVLETHITESGYAFILSGDGDFIVHPDMGNEGFEPNISSYGVDAAGMYRQILSGETGFISVDNADNPFFIAFSPIIAADWSIGVVVYEDELLSSLRTLSAQMDLLTVAAEENIAGMSEQALITFISIAAVFVVMVIFFALILTSIISKPIQKLADEVSSVGEGKLDKRIEGHYNIELDIIKDAVNSMAGDIKIYLNEKLTAERAAHEAELARLELVDKVNHDALTNIYNRRYLDESLHRLINTLSRTSGGTLSVFMIDVDYFKKFNDAYGHAHGDECLIAVAGAIRGCLTRADDFAARYGGEEFTVVLPNVGENGAGIVAQKILESVRSLRIPHESSDAGKHVTVSIGAASGKVTETATPDDFIKQADKALYASKQNGRNMYTFQPV